MNWLLFRRLRLPKGASMHSLRHSLCSHLLASGVPLPAVSARLGHGSIRTTQEIYSHMIHGQDDDAARKWEAFQNQPTGGSRSGRGACSEVVRPSGADGFELAERSNRRELQWFADYALM